MHPLPRRARRALAAAALTLAATAPHAANASHTGAGCGTPAGKTYTTSASCELTFRGFPILVFAEAQVSSGTASVHVWATFTDADGTPLVLSQCSASDSGYANCSSGFPDSSTIVDHYALQQTNLICHVQARGTGTYRCISGSGR